MMNKKAQLTIFIIAGILLISIMTLFFLFRSGIMPDTSGKPEENPSAFLSSCIEPKIKEATELISSQGGYINPSFYKTFRFKDETKFTNISYLCYNQNYYLPCINQEPMFIQHLKDEIHGHISEDVGNCFDALTSSLEKQGNVVDARYRGFEVDLMEEKVVLNIEGEIILTKSGETSKQEDFDIFIPSRFYDLAIVSQEIVSQEARFCNFEHLGYMLFYNQFNIDQFRTGDSILIYTIEHMDTKEKFRFAIRGCVIPPGI